MDLNKKVPETACYAVIVVAVLMFIGINWYSQQLAQIRVYNIITSVENIASESVGRCPAK
jgi:hypothetical protein